MYQNFNFNDNKMIHDYAQVSQSSSSGYDDHGYYLNTNNPQPSQYYYNPQRSQYFYYQNLPTPQNVYDQNTNSSQNYNNKVITLKPEFCTVSGIMIKLFVTGSFHKLYLVEIFNRKFVLYYLRFKNQTYEIVKAMMLAETKTEFEAKLSAFRELEKENTKGGTL